MCVCDARVSHGLMTSWWVLRGAHFPEGPAVNLPDNGRTETLNFNKDLINQDRARVIAAGTVGLDKWIKHTYTYMHTPRQSNIQTHTAATLTHVATHTYMKRNLLHLFSTWANPLPSTRLPIVMIQTSSTHRSHELHWTGTAL